jgi:hypothetical protein
VTPDELFDEIVGLFEQKKFTAGLAMAFIDLLTHLGVIGAGFDSFADVREQHVVRETLPGGRRANTLVVEVPGGKTISLRYFYNHVESYFHNEQKRFGYPTGPGYATGRWADYVPWLDALVTMTPEQVVVLRDRLRTFVLERIPAQVFDPSTVTREPAWFRRVIEEFSLTKQKGEPTGAAYQGLVYGFLKTDNPHLTVETRKVRTGSKRVKRIGDVDGWDGARLAVTAEVKQYQMKEADVDDLQNFAAQVAERGAIGMVVALGFEEGARPAIEALGLRALDIEDLARVVGLWDPVKQRSAANAMLYCFAQIEQNDSLVKRLGAFLQALERGEEPAEIVGSNEKV